MTVRPYTSVYWNVDVLHIGSTPIYLAPTLLLLKSLTACTLLYSTPTLLPLLEIQHAPILTSYSATFTRNTTPILNSYRLPFYSYSFTLQSLPYRCAEEIAKLQPDARRVTRETIFEQRETIAASSKTRANVQGGRRVQAIRAGMHAARGVVPPIVGRTEE